MPMLVKEVANLVGISVRTLHHYDDIGLLEPSETTEAGYRLYTDDDLETLQQILFFRELDFPLKKIKAILDQPQFNRTEALELHRRMLLEKRKRLDQMIATIDKTMEYRKGGTTMPNEEKFKGFDFSHNPYEKEARERWGDKVVDESNARIQGMSANDQDELKKQIDSIYREIALVMDHSPESDEAQAAIEKWYHCLQRFGTYSLDAFKGLGQMYVDDQRFTKNIDQYGDGLAVFMRDAMAVYADKRK